MKVKIEDRIDAVVEATQMALALAGTNAKMAWGVIIALRHPAVDQNKVIEALRDCCNRPANDYGDPSTLAMVMFRAAAIEHYLDLPPGPHIRQGYAGIGMQNFGGFQSRAENEFARIKGATDDDD